MRLTIYMIVLGLVACGDSGAKTTPDTSSDDTTTTSPDTTSEDGDDAADVPVTECHVGDTQTTTAAQAGLTLEVCGVRLELPPGLVDDGTAVTLTAIEPPLSAPFQRAFIGPVVQVTIDQEGDLPDPYLLHMPDTASEGGYRIGATYVASTNVWSDFEVCPEEGGVVFEATYSAVWAFFRDTEVFPASKEGLGDGTLKSTLEGASQVTWSTDDGYAIHDVDPGGLKSVQVAARYTPTGGSVRQLSITLQESSDHSYTPLQASLLDTASTADSYAWLEPVDGPATSAHVITVGTRIVGSFVVQARGEAATVPLTIEVDVATEPYRFPPESSCGPQD